jgi:hypothetical protein
MEINYIQFPKSLRDELALIYEFKRKHSELKKEYEKLINSCYGYISLEIINVRIGSKLQYAKKLTEKNPEIAKLLDFKIKYLDLYEEIRNAFLKYNSEVPDEAKTNSKNLDHDIVFYLINEWTKNYTNKLLETFEI